MLAERHKGCILVTGDGPLRALAEEHDIEVHGVLWIFDEIHRHATADAPALAAALRLFERDASVRLPRRELLAALRRYEAEV